MIGTRTKLVGAGLALTAAFGAAAVAFAPAPLPEGQMPEFTKVTLPDGARLSVANHEVTVAQWTACVEAGGCPAIDQRGTPDPEHPVINVNYYSAQAYINWFRERTGLDARLPAQSEWIAFAGEHAPEDKEKLFDDPRLAWAADYDLTAGPRIKVTQPAGAFGNNATGLADLKGNVWEWTATTCADGDVQGLSVCDAGRVAMGEHVSLMSELVGDPGNAGCGGGLPPSNLGFRIVHSG